MKKINLKTTSSPEHMNESLKKYNELHQAIDNITIALMGNSIHRYEVAEVNFITLNNLLRSIEKEYKRVINSSRAVSNLDFLTNILTKMYKCILDANNDNLKEYKKLIEAAPYRKYNHYKTTVGWRMYNISIPIALSVLCLAVAGGSIAAAPLASALIIIGIFFTLVFSILALAGLLLKNSGQAQTIMKDMNEFYKSIQNYLQEHERMQAINSNHPSLTSQSTEEKIQTITSTQPLSTNEASLDATALNQTYPLLKPTSSLSPFALLPENVIRNIISEQRHFSPKA